jgi:hypothetical protein
MGLAVLLQQSDRSFHSVEDLRDLDLPIAGGISLLEGTAPMRERLISTTSFAVAVLALCGVYGGLLYRLFHTSGGT